ncbi:uncharacterized protein LOC121860031 [Homarus americanus]|uniref:uncharacterized protein LOC121860031 n=1 Tax=Homarus americanus TaxID=6706 RepID=UPI001C43DC69|nr:uncharacterized protein LOC121860031 [Homarus americanus]
MMMMALVLVKSYAGNLMSALAVRHIEQPYQTLRDLLDDPSPTMIWPYNSKNVQYFKSVKSGIYQEVAEMESRGRIKYQAVNQFFHSIDILVRRGDHVLIAVEIVIDMLISRDVSQTGRCDFYMSRERLLPSILAPIGQKNRLLVPAISKMYSQYKPHKLGGFEIPEKQLRWVYALPHPISRNPQICFEQ